ncbi:glycoside hydrolase family 104 protein [Hydrocoleum sp. CS-953]|uniref:glycoside hydrolase family 24 protein n=1 Tax=Hydrocoleum sp. CS-953 TaxID=1671698 RepID=UPI000B9C2092|nr:glycoside hydrolase family 104 protein [Hydrocoleum sp. CS-953]
MYNQQAQQRSQQNKNSDFELINIWLQQIPPIQQSSHLYIAQMFLKFVRKPLEKVTSADVIAFANVQSINSHNRESHQHKRVDTINSLLKFGQQTGILPTTQKKILSPNTTNFKKSVSSQDKIKNYRTTQKVQKKTLNLSKLFNLQLASSLLIILGLFIAISQLFRAVGGGANAEKKGSVTSVVMPKIDPTKNWAYPVNVPRIRAFLDTISVTEGTTGPQGYYRQYTGSHFSSFKDHPRELKCALSNGKELCSDAAGRYQFLSTSWDRFAPIVKAKNFSPTYQDRVAIELIREKNALKDIEEGRIEEAFRKLYMVWPSFGETTADVERLMPKLIGTYEQKLALYQPKSE